MNLLRGIGVFLTLVALLILLLAALAIPGHAAIGKKHDNSLGAVLDFTNPNIYMFGAVADGGVFKDETGRVLTSVRFQPYGTSILYSENVLFCGDVSHLFPHGAIVTTYRRLAHEMSGGVGCHELISVDKVVSREVE